MTVLRRHLRLCAAAWIVFQAVSLSAFVPRDCCAAHRMAAAEDHQQDAGCHHARHAGVPETTCSLAGTCNGPLAMLAGVLSPHAVLTTAILVAGGLMADSSPLPVFESPRSLAVPPDAPPPRR